MLPHALASIPSPSHGTLHVGPLALHMYGLMLAIGILAAARVAEWRWERAGHERKQFTSILIPVIIGGVIGARVYHLFTGYKWSQGGITGAFEIWKGGLSIWGAVGGGAIALLIMARIHHLRFVEVGDAIAPGLALAQAIGRWGNYFNQELFGRPTKLPWALEIAPSHRPPGYVQYATFHPTFLYESLWCLALFGGLLWAERRFHFVRGQTLAAYIAGYCTGRVFFEWLRIDDASRIFGIRFNLLLSAALAVFGVVLFVWFGRRAVAPIPESSGETPMEPNVPLS